METARDDKIAYCQNYSAEVEETERGDEGVDDDAVSAVDEARHLERVVS